MLESHPSQDVWIEMFKMKIRKRKATAFLQSAGVQFPMEAKKNNGLLNSKISDESNLVKR